MRLDRVIKKTRLEKRMSYLVTLSEGKLWGKITRVAEMVRDM